MRISADDFVLIISVEETTLPRGENFVVNVRYKNQSLANIRMAITIERPSLAVPHVENWNYWDSAFSHRPNLPPGQWWFDLNHGEYHEATWLLGGSGDNDTLGIAMPRGTHELRFRAHILVDQFVAPKIVEVWSNVVILNVE